MKTTPPKTLFNPNFTLMVLGQIISQFGHTILSFALSLHILDLTGSATLFGSMLAMSTLPRILFAPVGGVLADRLPRQKIMYVLDFLTALAVWLFSLFVQTPSPLPAGALMLFLAVAAACYYPSVGSATPLLVPAEELTRANSVTNQVQALSNLLGPILGGMVYGFWGMAPVCLISAACYLASAVMECFLTIPFTPQQKKGGGLTSTVSDLTEAASFLSSSRLLPLLFIFAASNLFWCCTQVALPYHLKITLGLSAQLHSLVEAAAALGQILGAALTGLLGRRLSFSRLWKYILLSDLAFPVMALALLSTRSPLTSWAMILPAVFLSMVFSAFGNILYGAFVQQVTPTSLLGKVSALSSMLCQCAMPLGQGLYGILVEALPPWAVYAFAFAACVPLILLLRRGLTRLTLSETEKFSEPAV